MDALKIQAYIENWLAEDYATSNQREILQKILVVGKASHRWVETIQRSIEGKAMQRPSRGEIKMACRAILKKKDCIKNETPH